MKRYFLYFFFGIFLCLAINCSKSEYRDYYGRVTSVGISFYAEYVLIIGGNQYIYVPKKDYPKFKGHSQYYVTVRATTNLTTLKTADGKHTIKKTYFKKIKSVQYTKQN